MTETKDGLCNRRESRDISLWTATEVAEMLGITPNTVRHHARNGIGSKHGEAWMFTQADVDRLIARPRVGKHKRRTK